MTVQNPKTIDNEKETKTEAANSRYKKQRMFRFSALRKKHQNQKVSALHSYFQYLYIKIIKEYITEAVTYDYTGLNHALIVDSETSVSFTYRCSLWWNKAVNIFPGDASIRTRAWTENSSMYTIKYTSPLFYLALYSYCHLKNLKGNSGIFKPGPYIYMRVNESNI